MYNIIVNPVLKQCFWAPILNLIIVLNLFFIIVLNLIVFWDSRLLVQLTYIIYIRYTCNFNVLFFVQAQINECSILDNDILRHFQKILDKTLGLSISGISLHWPSF